MPDWDRALNLKISEFIRQNQIAYEKFTEQQLAKCLVEALRAGDFVKHVRQDGAEAVFYVPYAEIEDYRKEVYRVLKMVEDNFEYYCVKCGSTNQSWQFISINAVECFGTNSRFCSAGATSSGVCRGEMKWRVKS